MDLSLVLQWVDNSSKKTVTKESVKKKLTSLSRFEAFFTAPVTCIDESFKNLNTKVDLLLLVRALVRDCPHFSLSDEEADRLSKLTEIYRDERQQVYEKREKRESDVRWEDVLALRPRIKQRDLLLYTLITDAKPQRNVDYCYIRIVDTKDEEEDGNVYCRDEKCIYLREYKTSAERGEKCIPLSSTVTDLIPPTQKFLF